ncbi:hypothetical protein C2S52_007387 [Perilla frutescens var. hirtella]|nr:hypothetical protein C2S51_008491 [Perilla frutescens var. frutescens]KAH6787835.1 hypothetical protein C2S52_007387 [Perilla frutescens var. hirtella]
MSASLVRALLSDPFLSSEGVGLGLGPSEIGPAMDWKESPQAHIFKFDLPGLTKEDVKLQLHDDRVLHVSAVSREEEENKDCKWYCRERVGAGNFRREFRLPENAAVDEIKASMSDGVLVVRVAKDESKNKKKKHAKKRAVEIAGEGEDSGAAKGISRFVCFKA